MKVDDSGTLLRVLPEDLDEHGRFVCDDNIKRIGTSAFYLVRYLLSDIKLGSITEIGMNAFQDCVNLESIQFPNTLKKIGFSAFFGCYNIREVVLPENLEVLGKWAFKECSRLKYVEFRCPLQKGSLEEEAHDFLKNEVFSRCRQIQKFKFFGNVTFYEEFRQFEKLREIEITNRKVAHDFWFDAIFYSPQCFCLVDSKLFFDKDFTKRLIGTMELSFSEKFGGNEVLAKDMAAKVFEHKLDVEEKNYINKENNEKYIKK